jgi:hypothetical protein
MKSVPLPDRPGPWSVRRNWTEELATQFWGEDDATTVFANQVGQETAPPPEGREPARKLRPRGRPRDLRPRRPGPRSPGFEGVWLAANVVPAEPVRAPRVGSLLAVGLVIFGVGLAAGRLFLGRPFAPLAGEPSGPFGPVGASAPLATRATAAPAAAALTASSLSGRPAPASRPSNATAGQHATPAKKRHRVRSLGRRLETADGPSPTDDEPSPDLLVPRPRSIVKVDALDLTLPDRPGP